MQLRPKFFSAKFLRLHRVLLDFEKHNATLCLIMPVECNGQPYELAHIYRNGDLLNGFRFKQRNGKKQRNVAFFDKRQLKANPFYFGNVPITLHTYTKLKELLESC